MSDQQVTQDQTPGGAQQVPTDEQAATLSDELAVGPVDYLAVEFPGARLTGEGLAALIDLVERGVIRLLDLRAAKVEENGDITAVEITDLDGDGTLDLAVFTGASSGLIGEDDVATSAGLIEPGNAVAILLYENTWAGPFVAALRRAGAEVIASGRIPAAEVIATLEALEGEDVNED